MEVLVNGEPGVGSGLTVSTTSDPLMGIVENSSIGVLLEESFSTDTDAGSEVVEITTEVVSKNSSRLVGTLKLMTSVSIIVLTIADDALAD